MKFFLAMPLIFMAMMSCVQNEEVNDSAVEIKLNAEIAASVKGKSAMNPGDPLTGVQFAKIDGESPDWTGINSIILTGNLSTQGTITFTPTPYYPADGSVTNLLAYFPAANTLAAGVASMKITGAEDVMYAAPVEGSKTTPMTNILLAHKLTQFAFVVKREAASTTADITNVSLAIKEANTTFDMTLETGELSNWGTPLGTITPLTAGTATIADSTPTTGIMLEPDMTSINLLVSATGYTSREVTISGTDAGKFMAGKSYTITLTFKGKSIESTASIAEWTPGTAGSGELQ